jgi:hypothetical protein
MEHLRIDIQDQYGDTLLGHVEGHRAYLGTFSKDGKTCEIELIGYDVKRLRDWCDEVLESGEME